MAGRSFAYLRNELFPKRRHRFPLDWSAEFSGPAPLAVEIGFGNGDFLVNWARSRPEWHFVGIELSLGSMERALRQIARAGLTNVRLVRDNAGFVLRELFPDASLRHVMMNFPDPWPKERHRSRRLIQQPFLDTLAAVLEKGGCFELVTDQAWYAQQTHALFAADPAFHPEPVAVNPPRPVQTKYERKWRAMGRDSYQILARKVNHRPVKRLILEEPMPHRFLDTPIQPEMVRALEGRQFRQAASFFVIKEILAGIQKKDYLVHVVSQDGEYLQKFFIRIHPHGPQWLVKLDEVTQPYRTPAVKLAVFQVADWLSGQAPAE